MRRTALAKKHNEPRKRKETRLLLSRWGNVAEFCEQTNEEIGYFQKRVSEVSEMRARSEIRVSGGKTSDPTARSVEDLEKLEKEYEKCVIDGQQQVKREIEFKRLMDEIISGIDPEDWALLVMRYKKGWSWVMIAAKLCISVEGATKRERRIIDQIDKKIKVEQKSTEK